MHYKLEGFELTENIDVLTAVELVPPDATQLNLRHPYWNTPDRQRLFTEVLKVLPPTLTTLSPDDAIKRKYYSDTQFSNSLFRYLPTHITELKLAKDSICESYARSNIEPTTILASIPYSVTSVHIKGCLYKKTTADLIEIINALPAHVTNLSLTDQFFFEKVAGSLRDIASENISHLIQKLPTTLTSLGLKGNELGHIATPMLIQTIKALSRNITSLNLDGNFWDEKTPAEYAAIFRELPPNLNTLDLSWNFLEVNGNHEHLISIFNVLPKNLTTLCLRNTSIPQNSEARIGEIFKALPRQLTSLDLSDNNMFEGKDSSELGKALKELPSLKTLYLNNTVYHSQNAGELETILSNLPDSITSLYLENNKVQARAILAVILSSVGSKVTSLYLGHCELDKISGIKLTHAFHGMSRGVTSLHLDHNALGKIITELAPVFAAIPTSVTSLNLSHNNLHLLKIPDFAAALQALHANMNSLNLGHNLLYTKTPAELNTIFQALPAELTALDLSHNGFHLLSAAELTQVFTPLPDSIKTLTLSVEDIAMRSEEELRALGKALPHVMKVQICDPSGKLVSHASLDTLKMHIGGWIRESNDQKQHSLKSIPVTVCDIISKLATNTEVLERQSFFEEQDRERKCQPFNSHLNTIYLKAIELQRRGFNKESCELNKLHTQLRSLKDQYCQGQIKDIEFRREALPKITEAKPKLETHRGGKEIYLNILLFILGLGVIYAAVCAFKGRFFKTNTDSVDKLIELEDSLNKSI